MAAEIAAKSLPKWLLKRRIKDRIDWQNSVDEAFIKEFNDALQDRAARRREDAFMAKAKTPAKRSTHGLKGDGSWNLEMGRCIDCHCDLMIPLTPYRRDFYCMDCWPWKQRRTITKEPRLKPIQVQWVRWFVGFLRG
jgi:hypothetical protein